MIPTVGRLVHYCDERLGTLAALIVAVWSADECTVRLFHPDGPHLDTNVKAVLSDKPAVGCWSWPPRV